MWAIVVGMVSWREKIILKDGQYVGGGKEAWLAGETITKGMRYGMDWLEGGKPP